MPAEPIQINETEGAEAVKKPVSAAKRAFSADAVNSAIRNGNLEKVKKLLKKDHFNIDDKGHGGYTPLITAILYDKSNIARYLLKKSADVNIQDDNGHTALITAAVKDVREPIVKLLLEQGADVDVRTCYGNTALITAVRGGSNKIARLLLEAGCDVNVQNKQCESALLIAVQRGNLDLVKELVAHGASLDLKDGRNRTPLDAAEEKGFFNTGNFLRSVMEERQREADARAVLEAAAAVQARHDAVTTQQARLRARAVSPKIKGAPGLR